MNIYAVMMMLVFFAAGAAITKELMLAHTTAAQISRQDKTDQCDWSSAPYLIANKKEKRCVNVVVH